MSLLCFHVTSDVRLMRTRRSKQGWKLVSRNDQLGVGVATHPVDSAGRASPDRVRVATGMLGGDGNGAIRAAYDCTLVIKRVGAAVVDHEARVLGTTHKGDAGAHFNAEGFV